MIGVGVVGSTMIDMVAYSPRIPVIGETIFGSKFVQNYGGKGANQMVMVANLGTKASMFCKVGNDSLGAGYVASLRGMGVTVHDLQHETESTGIACITVDDTGNNSIVIIPGANVTITENEVRNVWAEHILQCRVVVCQNEITSIATRSTLELIREHNNRLGTPDVTVGTAEAEAEAEVATAVFPAKHSHHIVTVFNPAPVGNVEACLACAVLADIVCPNEIELGMLVSMPTDTMEQIEAAVKQLLILGCSAVVVTLGPRGACVGRSDTPGLEFVTAPVVKNCVDTVGAGDCFIGSLASQMHDGVALMPAVEFAIRAASLSVTREGSQKSYPSRSEVMGQEQQWE